MTDIIDPGGGDTRTMLDGQELEDVKWEQDPKAFEVWKPEEQREEFWCGLRYVEGKNLPKRHKGTIMEVTIYQKTRKDLPAPIWKKEIQAHGKAKLEYVAKELKKRFTCMEYEAYEDYDYIPGDQGMVEDGTVDYLAGLEGESEEESMSDGIDEESTPERIKEHQDKEKARELERRWEALRRARAKEILEDLARMDEEWDEEEEEEEKKRAAARVERQMKREKGE
jgi:hypothetical protein